MSSNFIKSMDELNKSDADFVKLTGDSVMFSMATTSPIVKKMMIESQAGSGKCYLRILPCLPGYKTIAAVKLETSIIHMISKLGSNPLCTAVLEELFIVNEFYEGRIEDFDNEFQLTASLLTVNNTSISMFLRKLWDSSVKFAFEELNGVFHIGQFIENDGCLDVICAHGFSSKFVTSMLVKKDTKIGAGPAETINLEELFGAKPTVSSTPEEVDEFVSTLSTMQKEVSDRDNEISKLSEMIERLNNKVKEQVDVKSKINPSVAEMFLQMKQEVREELEAIAEVKSELTMMNVIKSQDNQIVDSILPIDSSSNLSRYDRKFLRPGSVLTVGRNGVRQEQEIVEISKLQPIQEVVKGYVKTVDQLAVEEESNSKIRPINGLANPFKNHRLNLLSHFHTALNNININVEHMKDASYQSLRWLNDYESKTPSEELAHQMIIRTFDFRNQVVIANPFKFPYLEIGMLISEDCLVKSFDLLYGEYRILYFNEMKSLIVPDFHQDFIMHKEHRFKPIRKSQSHKSQSNQKPSNSSSRSKGQRSLLGFNTNI